MIKKNEAEVLDLLDSGLSIQEVISLSEWSVPEILELREARDQTIEDNYVPIPINELSNPVEQKIHDEFVSAGDYDSANAVAKLSKEDILDESMHRLAEHIVDKLVVITASAYEPHHVTHIVESLAKLREAFRGSSPLVQINTQNNAGGKGVEEGLTRFQSLEKKR